MNKQPRAFGSNPFSIAGFCLVYIFIPILFVNLIWTILSW